MNNKSITENANENFRLGMKNFRKFLDEYDAQAWPAFFVFLVVITLGMVLNYFGFYPIVGVLPALVISGVFESAIVAWKMTCNRKRNDATQNQLANWATWLSVALAIIMLTVNLFRIGGDKNFESLAYIIVGLAASIQVIFYLWFDQADPDKKMSREWVQSGREITREDRNADGVLLRTESRMKIIRKIATDLARLQNDYRDLPTMQLEYLLEEARKKLLDQYANGDADINNATSGLSDINGDGKIGQEQISKERPSKERPSMR